MVSKVKFPKNIINGVLILLFSAIGNMLVALLKIDHGETYSVVQVQLWGSFWLVVVTFIIVVITYAYLLPELSNQVQHSQPILINWSSLVEIG
ncbi:hypothetical protein [Lactiplantibacillus xiangfangensis]|uniref:hypothetical protein n=1 Tax=Lactiplantibacillus xiangfangensis TaxID=942150 RepID=UPI00384A6D06